MLVRSGTQVTKEIIQACSSKMKIIGRAGVGVDNIDVQSATEKGIIVVNSPDGNTTAAAEHTFALMISMARFIPSADKSIKSGKWDRKSFIGVELRNKNLGIIGLGKIGSKVAEMALACGMKIFAFDPLATKERAKSLGVSLVEDINQIWTESDFISLHVPKNEKTVNLINKNSISKMRDGVRIVNCSRGGVINEEDITEAVKSGKVAGIALDVFDQEPVRQDSPLFSLGDKAVLTPHLGACTEEAQINVAIDVAQQIKEVLTGGFATNSVNLSGLKSNIQNLDAYMGLCKILGKFLDQYAGDNTRPKALNIRVTGDLAKENIEPLILSVLSGFLSQKVESATLVNARKIAKEKSLKIIEQKIEEQANYSEEITIELETEEKNFAISGILENKKLPVITSLNKRKFFLNPTEHMLLTLHNDQPGVIAKIGSVLAKNNININGMALGRKSIREEALMVCTVDEPISNNILEEIRKLSETLKASYIKL